MQPTSLLRRSLLRVKKSLFLPLLRASLPSLALLSALLFALLPPAGAAHAQLATERNWTVFRQSDGLLSNAIYAIHVTDDAIWFGTDRGISRYDGQWQTVPFAADGPGVTANSQPVTPGNVAAMAGTAGALWAGTDRGYLAQWNGEGWVQAQWLDAGINDLALIGGGLWVAQAHGLLVMADGKSNAIPALGMTPVYDIAVTPTHVWLGTESGLWRLSLDGDDAVNVSVAVAPVLEQTPVHAVWSDGSDSLWLGMGAQVVQYFPNPGFANIYQPFESESTRVAAITGVEGESVWITTAGRGVTQFMFANGVQVSSRILGGSTEGGLETDEVRTVSIDRDGSVWFATPVGAYRYKAWAWQDVDAQVEGLAVTDLLQDRQGALWIATTGEGIQRRKSLYQRPTSFYPGETVLPSEYVNDLEEDARGGIWAATNGGVARFDGDRWTMPLPARALPSPIVLHLQADNQQMWIGTAAGLARYRSTTRQAQVEPQFDGQRISALEFDELGRLWVATQTAGLWRYTEGAGWARLGAPEAAAPASGLVTALLPDPALPGSMFVAFQDEGIYRWNDQRWENVDGQRWTKGDRVLALGYEPSDGSLWIGSEIGLSRLDPFSLTTYDANDGLQNGAIRAILRDAGGSYWFGGQKGLSYYRPERTAPWLHLGEVQSLGAELGEDGWRLFTGRPVEVLLTAGDLQSSPGALRLFYRLTGAQNTFPWRESAARAIALPPLAHGDYELEVMVRDRAFNYSAPAVHHLRVFDPPATMRVPFLGEVQTSIAQLLLLFGGLACIGFGYVTYEITKHRLAVTAAVRRGYNPYISGEPVRREEMFFGRRNLLARIVATLHNNSIMIHGERRIGKTTLLYQLAHALRQVQDPEYWFVPVFIDLEGTTEQRLFYALMEEIAHTVTALPEADETDIRTVAGLQLHESEETRYTDREFSRDLRVAVRLLERYSSRCQNGRQVRLILLIDEVDTLSTFDHLYQQQLRRIFMRDFAATVGAVVAGIAISKEWDRVESPWFNLFNEIAMEPFTLADAVELIVEPVRGYYLYEAEALNFIIANSGGRPYRLQQYALEAVNHMLQARRRRIKLDDVLYAHEQILAVGGQLTAGLPPSQLQVTTGGLEPAAVLR